MNKRNSILIFIILVILFLIFKLGFNNTEFEQTFKTKSKTHPTRPQKRSKVFRIDAEKIKAVTAIKRVQAEKIDCFSKLLKMVEKNDFVTRNTTEIANFVGPWLLTNDSPVYDPDKLMSNSEKFVTALYFANLLSGRKNQNTDLEGAYNLLSQVSESEPQNSTPLLYLLHLDTLLNDGANQEKLIKKVRQPS